MKDMKWTKRIAVWAPLAAVGLILGGCATISENTHAYK